MAAAACRSDRLLLWMACCAAWWNVCVWVGVGWYPLWSSRAMMSSPHSCVRVFGLWMQLFASWGA